MKILDVKKLKRLISENRVYLIKMKTKVLKDYNNIYTYDTNSLYNFKITEFENYISVEWETSEGDPQISLLNDEQLIDYISDSCYSDYKYRLYIE